MYINASNPMGELNYYADCTLTQPPVPATGRIASSDGIFYPKAGGTYQFEGIKVGGRQICFKATHDDALFYSITFTKEEGKRGIAIDSEYVEEMKQFLVQNDIPIHHVFGSSCQYKESIGINNHRGKEVSTLAHYYTTDEEVGAKLLKILREKNQFELNEQNENLMDEFFKYFASSSL
jgi:hypothetical protein